MVKDRRVRIAFRGFHKEKMHLEIREDMSGHDHLWIISSEGKELCYLHISDSFMCSWRAKHGDFNLDFCSRKVT